MINMTSGWWRIPEFWTTSLRRNALFQFHPLRRPRHSTRGLWHWSKIRLINYFSLLRGIFRASFWELCDRSSFWRLIGLWLFKIILLRLFDVSRLFKRFIPDYLPADEDSVRIFFQILLDTEEAHSGAVCVRHVRKFLVRREKTKTKMRKRI